jgi:hypothetical protein
MTEGDGDYVRSECLQLDVPDPGSHAFQFTHEGS